MDFWDVHSIGFCIVLVLFPRLTLLLSNVVSGGFFWWFGWLFAPRLLVAILATTYYWHTNTVLCVFVWIWALSGESAEKSAVVSARSNEESSLRR